MSLLVLDPVVLVNAAKVPDGASAKLLTLLAYGRTVEYLTGGAAAEQRRLAEVRAASPPAARDCALDDGSWSMDGQALAYSVAAKTALERSIPPAGRRDHYSLAISKKLIDCVVRRIGMLRDTEELELDAGVVAAAISSHASRRVSRGWGTVPNYTDSRKVNTDANVCIHTALRAGAPLVVTKLRDACRPDEPKLYYPADGDQSAPLGATKAVHFDHLVDLLSRDFDFHAIDAAVLGRIAPSGGQRPERRDAGAGGDASDERGGDGARQRK